MTAAAGQRLTYGIQAVRLALARGRVERVFLQSNLGAKRFGRLVSDLRRAGVSVTEVGAGDLQRLTGSEKHQGIAAEVHGTVSLGEREAHDLIRSLETPLILVLDGVQDPRNFGSILRTADAAGVDLVVTARSRNVAITPVVSKVACGAAEAQTLAEVSNLARFLAGLRDAAIRIVGADGDAQSTLFETDLAGPLALVLGAEGEGLRRLTRESCHEFVRLPMQGVVESLNVGVVAGICLYEAVRQRRLARPHTLR